jgi:hypothetical protein
VAKGRERLASSLLASIASASYHHHHLFDHAPAPYFVTDEYGVIREANQTLGVRDSWAEAHDLPVNRHWAEAFLLG